MRNHFNPAFGPSRCFQRRCGSSSPARLQIAAFERRDSIDAQDRAVDFALHVIILLNDKRQVVLGPRLADWLPANSPSVLDRKRGCQAFQTRLFVAARG